MSLSLIILNNSFFSEYYYNMATITPVDGPPEVVNARRTESLDAPHIIKLVSDSTNQLFGRVNVVNLM
jgi:hypothetical protein